MLTQEAADFLARVTKHITSATVVVVPPVGGRQEWQAQDYRGRDKFYLHMRRGRKMPTQMTMQQRYQTNEILLRLDIDGPAHTNPDGTIIPTPHLHIYREGYEDKWAFPIPDDFDISSRDPARILVDFLRYCGVDPIPPIQGGM